MVNKQEIKKIAELSKIDFVDYTQMEKDLNDIIGYVGQIKKIESTNTKTSGNILKYQSLREDIEQDSLSHKKALFNTPSKSTDIYFSVPKTVDR